MKWNKCLFSPHCFQKLLLVSHQLHKKCAKQFYNQKLNRSLNDFSPKKLTHTVFFFLCRMCVVLVFISCFVCLKVMQLQRESGSAEEHSLDKEARKWASRVAREYKSIIHTQRVRTGPSRVRWLAAAVIWSDVSDWDSPASLSHNSEAPLM